MNTFAIEPGRLVRSMAGRDAGRLFAVIAQADADFVLVADGKLRTLERPKKKRRKHVKPLGGVFSALAEGKPIQNHELRQWICEEEGKLVQV